MKLGEFFKPDLRKILVFLALFIISSFVPLFTSEYPKNNYKIMILGLPFNYYFYKHCRFCAVLPMEPKITPFSFAVDMVIWYILSCLVVWIYDKLSRIEKPEV